MKHPSTRAERLRLKEVKREKKLQAAEKRAERLQLSLRRAEAAGFDTDYVYEKAKKDGPADDYEGNLQ